MKRSTSLATLGVAALLGSSFVGCGESAPETASNAPTSSSAPDNTDTDSAATFVSLKVPNMH
jgi:hypothetical protein